MKFSILKKIQTLAITVKKFRIVIWNVHFGRWKNFLRVSHLSSRNTTQLLLRSSLYYVRLFWSFLNHLSPYIRTFSVHKVRENHHQMYHQIQIKTRGARFVYSISNSGKLFEWNLSCKINTF